MPNTQTITLTGFDPAGEPEITQAPDGPITILFNFMPPSDAQEDPASWAFEAFDRRMAHALGCPVAWEDRECFVLPEPKPDTLNKLITYLTGYRAGKHLQYIRILHTPSTGPAPDEVRRHWAGLVLPLSDLVDTQPKQLTNHPDDPTKIGFWVEARTALHLLAQTAPDAAQWWQNHAPALMQAGQHLVFACADCERIEPPTS